MTISRPSLPALTSVMNIYVVYGQSNSTGTAAAKLYSVTDPTFGAAKLFGLDGRGSRNGTDVPTSWCDIAYPPSVLVFTALPATEIQEPLRARVRECFFFKMLDVLNRAQIAATGQRHRAVAASFGHTGYTIAQLISGENAYTNLVAGVTEICVDVIAAGLTPKIRGVIFVQSEANFAASGSGYAATVGTLQTNLETSLKAVTGQTEAVPMFITQQSNFGSSGTGFAGSIAYPILDQLSAHTTYADKVILASPMYQGETISNSNLHYYGHQAWRWGAGVGNAVAAKIINGTTWNPVRPKTITVASNIVDIEFHVPSGALVLDTTNATNTADGFYGFDFQQTGGTTTLTSVTLLNSTTVRFTLSGAPDGAYPRIRAGRNSAAGVVVSGLRTGARTCLRDSANSDARQCNWCTHFDTPIYPNILDNISTASTAAYSLRKLRAAYSGSAIRVRRSSDNVEADIGFTADGDLNQVALLAHCGANNGFVTTWYDQSGNARNVTQATAGSQPQIVTSGVVNLEGGKPSIAFDGVDDGLVNTAVGLPVGTNARSMNVVYTPRTTAGSNGICGQGVSGASSGQWFVFQNRGPAPAGNPYFAGFSLDLTDSQAPTLDAKVATATFASTNLTLFRNGTQFATAVRALNTTGNSLAIGSSPSFAERGNLFMKEITFFAINLDATNRQTLERNQGQYYGITVA